MRKYERKNAVYVGFIDLEKAYDRVNREALCQVLSGIKSMYVDSLACVRVKGSESEWFRRYSGVRQGCIMSPWLLHVYMDGVMKDGKERSEIPGGGERVEIT